MSGDGKAALYWRRGSRVTPGVMTLEGGVLSYRTEREELFRVEASQVEALFSRFSTLIVTASGRKFVFVTGAYAGALAPRFSTEQIAEVAGAASADEANRTFATGAAILVSSTVAGSIAAMAGSLLGRIASIGGGAVGAVTLFTTQGASFALARAWADFLAANGVRITIKGTTFARSQWFIAAIVLPSLAVFVVSIYAILSALQG